MCLCSKDNLCNRVVVESGESVFALHDLEELKLLRERIVETSLNLSFCFRILDAITKILNLNEKKKNKQKKINKEEVKLIGSFYHRIQLYKFTRVNFIFV